MGRRTRCQHGCQLAPPKYKLVKHCSDTSICRKLSAGLPTWSSTDVQRLKLVPFSAQHKHLLWARGC